MKTKLVVILGFLVAFSAGLVVGIWSRQPASAATPTPPGVTPPADRSWLARELNLDSARAEEVRMIWSEAMRTAERERDDKRKALRKERDDALLAIIRPDQRATYDRVLEDYNEKMSALGRERGKAFDEAVARTKLVLTPEQREKYEALLKKREAERADREKAGGGGNGSGSATHGVHGRRTGDRATTRPASD